MGGGEEGGGCKITAVVAASDYCTALLLLHARFHIPYYYRLLYTQAIPSLALISVGQPRLASCCSLTAYTARVAWATVCLAVIAASIPSINQLGRASGTPVSEQPTAAVSHDQGQQPAPNHWLCGAGGEARRTLGGRLTFTYLSLIGYATLLPVSSQVPQLARSRAVLRPRQAPVDRAAAVLARQC
jgi:hypothetical protein